MEKIDFTDQHLDLFDSIPEDRKEGFALYMGTVLDSISEAYYRRQLRNTLVAVRCSLPEEKTERSTAQQIALDLAKSQHKFLRDSRPRKEEK